jgi:hypothetical protein
MNTVTEALGEHLPDRDVWKSFVSGLLGPHGWTTTRVTDGPKIVGTAKWYVSPFAAVAVFRMGDWLNGSAIELPFSKTGTASTIRHAGGVGVLFNGTSPTTWPVSAGVSTTTISGTTGDLVVLTLFFAESFGAEPK